MSEARIVNPLEQQFRAGGVPRELRLLAAQGALPLKPVDLLELVHHLHAPGSFDRGQRPAASIFCIKDCLRGTDRLVRLHSCRAGQAAATKTASSRWMKSLLFWTIYAD